MEQDLFQSIITKFPGPYAIKSDQISKSYQSLYDKLLDSYNKKNFIRIYNLLYSAIQSGILLSLSLSTEEDSTLLLNLANLLYEIITIYPVKYLKTQLSAVIFFNIFLNTNEYIPNLVLDWRSFYKVMKYYTFSDEFYFIFGENIPKDPSTNVNMLSKLLNLSLNISKYFIDEYETEKVKTNTTEQLVKKFFPKISPNGEFTTTYLMFFCHLCPPHKGRYKLYIDFILRQLNDTSKKSNLHVIFTLILQIIKSNIEDDFSFLLPIISQFISANIVSKKPSKLAQISVKVPIVEQILSQNDLSPLLAKIMVALFISPPTRNQILDLLKNFFISFKSEVHPSKSNSKNSPFDLFNLYLIVFLNLYLMELTDEEKKGKIMFNMKKELGPSQDDIHKLIQMTSELRIMNIRKCKFLRPVLIEVTLDPSITDYYFNVAYQCINFMDTKEENISTCGWVILASIIKSIDKNITIQKNIENIIEIAANNLYRIELQQSIASFLQIFFTVVPFNKENTVKRLEHLNFPRLASLIFSNLMNVFRTFPSKKGKIVDINNSVIDMFVSFTSLMIKYSDDDVKHEIMTIIASLATDEDITSSCYCVQAIVMNFSSLASLKQVQTISDVFKKQLLSKKHNLIMLRFLMAIYACILPAKLKTIESIKEVTDTLLPFTQNEDPKVRKAAWNAIVSSTAEIRQVYTSEITIKKDKINQNLLQVVKFEDIDIKWSPLPDFDELMFELFDPAFNKLLTLEDPYEINKLLKDIKAPLVMLFENFHVFTEGSIKNEVEEFFNDPFFVIPEKYKQSVPLRDKFIKCASRIIKEFPDNNLIIKKILEIICCLFTKFHQSNSVSVLGNLGFTYIPFDHSGEYVNIAFIDIAISKLFVKRKGQVIFPIQDDLKQLLNTLFEYSISKYKSFHDLCEVMTFFLHPCYRPLLKSIVSNITNKVKQEKFNEYTNLIYMVKIPDIIEDDYELVTKIMLITLNNFDSIDSQKLKELKIFVKRICISSLPIESEKSNVKEFINLLNEIETNYLNKNQNNRTYNYILIHIIFACLKYTSNVSDAIFEFVMINATHFDIDISIVAQACFSHLLKKREKYTKERIEIKQFPTIASFPDVLDQVSVKYKDDGIYFPMTLRAEKSDGSFKLDNVDLNLTRSLDINLLKINENDDVKSVFESFKNIEIEWKSDDKNFDLFDSKYFFDHANGYFLYKDHFYYRRYEFKDDKMLIKNIANIFLSASHAINEKNQNQGSKYHLIWQHYSATVGPHCIQHLHELSMKYLSEYYSSNLIVPSIILYGMIRGFMSKICYWSRKDRIDFFKLVVLPVVCILLSNANTSNVAESIINETIVLLSPFCTAPLIKVLFCLCSPNPNQPIHNRKLVWIFSNQILMKPFSFFNTIDHYKEKYIDTFIKNINEYELAETHNIFSLIFSLFSSCSLMNEKSPLFSKEIEEKRNEIIKSFDTILDKRNVENISLRKNFIYALSLSFSIIEKSSNDLRSFVVPLCINHLHTILNLLKTTNIKEEKTFIHSIGSFFESKTFFINTEIEFKFVSILIKELMNLSLPMQLILLEYLNKMIECNIFNIPKNDYEKYEKIILDYGNFAKTKNLGNELRLKIAKILGIFEIRKNNFDEILVENDNQRLVDDEVLKAASIILNSFLFDRGDEKLTKSFNTMEEFCTSKKSKDKEFFKNVSEIFIYRHTDHVLRDVEEMIIQYKGILTPSYIY